jgi:hypothetical protein
MVKQNDYLKLQDMPKNYKDICELYYKIVGAGVA